MFNPKTPGDPLNPVAMLRTYKTLQVQTPPNWRFLGSLREIAKWTTPHLHSWSLTAHPGLTPEVHDGLEDDPASLGDGISKDPYLHAKCR